MGMRTPYGLILLLLCLTWSGAPLQAKPFDREQEFPNLFLTAAERAHPETVSPARLEQLERLVAGAARNILSRITVPIVRTSAAQMERVRLLSHVTQELQKIDPQIEVEPSGGVVRSVLAMIYDRLYMAHLQQPDGINAENLLLAMAEEQGDLPHTDLGKGSDFDLLLRSSNSRYQELRPQLEDRGRQVLNSAAYAIFGQVHMDMDSETQARSLVLRADFHDYEAQIERVSHFGGSTLDHLSFSMKGQGHFREPHPSRVSGSILHSFLRGEVVYLAEAQEPRLPEWRAEERAIKTLRGFRALPEIPFLRIAPGESEKTLSHELNEIEMALDQGKMPSSDAFRVYQTLERNGRHANAHNRFLRSQNNPVESEFMHLTARLQAATKKLLIHEMVPELPLGRPAKTVPAHFLMDWQKFREQYTNNGVVYHGTPDGAAALSILQAGAYLSRPTINIELAQGIANLPAQGRGNFGPAAYTTHNEEIATQYESVTGLSLNLVFNKPQVRIFEWKSSCDQMIFGGQIQDPWFYSLAQRAVSEVGSNDLISVRGRIFEILRDEYGIDIIINTHTLIVNWNAVDRPRDILVPKLNQIQDFLNDPRTDPSERFQLAHQGLMLGRVAQASANAGHYFQPESARRLLENGLANPDSRIRIIAAGYLHQLTPTEATRVQLKKALWEAFEKEENVFSKISNSSDKVFGALGKNADFGQFIEVLDRAAQGISASKELEKTLHFLNNLYSHHHYLRSRIPEVYQSWEEDPKVISGLAIFILRLDESRPENFRIIDSSLKLLGNMSVFSPALVDRVTEMAKSGYFKDKTHFALLSHFFTGGEPELSSQRREIFRNFLMSERVPQKLRQEVSIYACYNYVENVDFSKDLIDFFLSQNGAGLEHRSFLDRLGSENHPGLRAWFVDYVENHPDRAIPATDNARFLAHRSVLLALLKTNLVFKGYDGEIFLESLHMIDFEAFSPEQRRLLLRRYARLLSSSETANSRTFLDAALLHQAALRFATQDPSHPSAEAIQNHLMHLNLPAAADLQCIANAMGGQPK